MSENREERIQRLLREGLDLYGEDEVSGAIVAWEKVLELDSDNASAKDYIRTADRRILPRPPKQAGFSGARTALIQEAQLLLRQGEFSSAYDLLCSASGSELGGLEYEAVFDLARSRLYGVFGERVGDLTRAPRVRSEAGAPTGYNLPQNAGFVLSMVDGETSFEDLIALSGMDAFDALHTLCGLIDSGLVERVS